MLHDEPGTLSSILAALAQESVNILTINSIIPTNGCALVTISAQTSEISLTLEDLLTHLGSIPGVIKAEVLAG